MPDRDVASAIGEQSEQLLHRLTENADLCQMVMGLLSQVALIAHERRMNLSGVRVGPVTMRGRRLAAKVTFSRKHIHREAPEIQQVNSFMHFLKSEAEGLYLFVAKNPDFLYWMRQLIQKMEAYAKDTNRRFQDLTIGNFLVPGREAPAFVDQDDHMVVELDP